MREPGKLIIHHNVYPRSSPNALLLVISGHEWLPTTSTKSELTMALHIIAALVMREKAMNAP